MVVDNILSNLTGISFVLTQIKSEQKMASSNLEDLKKVIMTDLRALSKNVSDFFLRLKTLNKEQVTPTKFMIQEE